MAQLEDNELTELGREAAQAVVGPGNINEVEVTPGQDAAGEPAHHFWFRWDPPPDWQQVGLAHIRLRQKLVDQLMARGDDAHLFIHILNRQDWDQYKRA